MKEIIVFHVLTPKRSDSEAQMSRSTYNGEYVMKICWNNMLAATTEKKTTTPSITKSGCLIHTDLRHNHTQMHSPEYDQKITQHKYCSSRQSHSFISQKITHREKSWNICRGIRMKILIHNKTLHWCCVCFSHQLLKKWVIL